MLQDATTLVQVLAYGHLHGLPVTKVLLRPVTGRRHQLRVHLQHCGHPIVGDFNYNPHATGREAARMMLHAWRLVLRLHGVAASYSFKARKHVAFEGPPGGSSASGGGGSGDAAAAAGGEAAGSAAAHAATAGAGGVAGRTDRPRTVLPPVLRVATADPFQALAGLVLDGTPAAEHVAAPLEDDD